MIINPECKYGVNCKAFVRVSQMIENVNNYNCNGFDDMCHLAIYKHPPRIQRNDSILFDNINQFETITNIEEKQDGGGSVIDALVGEIGRNNFLKDLCLNNQDLKEYKFSLLKLVNEKWKHQSIN